MHAAIVVVVVERHFMVSFYSKNYFMLFLLEITFLSLSTGSEIIYCHYVIKWCLGIKRDHEYLICHNIAM